jgi:hypothetical protein
MPALGSFPNRMTSAWNRSTLRGALGTSAILAVVALAAGMVRILPWLLDPSVTWRIAAPFARSLAVVAGEAALAVGWPVGWALATSALVERGEGRVLQLLGERPARTVARLAGQGLVLGVMLGGLSWASARESTEPGRIVTELIADGEAACAKADAPRTYTVPFFGATWLCAPGHLPRLVGQGPGPLARLAFSAREARASGDLGSLELDDVHLAFPGASLHVGALRLRGAAPWGHASRVTPLSRASALAPAVALSAMLVVGLVLLQRTGGRLGTLAVAASGPLVALGALRAVERVASPPFGLTESWLIGAILPLALLAPLAMTWLVALAKSVRGRTLARNVADC